jgi:hypothetical protein
MAAYFDRLAFIANKTAEVAARMEELEQLRKQIRKAERLAAGVPAIRPNDLNRGRLAEEKPRPH